MAAHSSSVMRRGSRASAVATETTGAPYHSTQASLRGGGFRGRNLRGRRAASGRLYPIGPPNTVREVATIRDLPRLGRGPALRNHRFVGRARQRESVEQGFK